MKCPNCGFEDHLDEEVKFCQECGIYLINNCSNDQCETNNNDEKFSLPNNAKFCPYCGSISTFNKEGYFNKE